MSELGADVWEKWRAIVSEQIASGQSVAAFCKERGVTSSQLFVWKKRLREAEKVQFVEVQVRPAEPLLGVVNWQQARAIEVKLCRGRSIVVEPGFDADHLRALLAVLEPEA
jgi:transposase-like protein